MTNWEWIQQLDKKQLIKLMRTFKDFHCEFCSYNTGLEDNCGYCFDGQVEWLDMEHDENGWEERDTRYCV